MHRLVLLLPALVFVSGCPSSTTLDTDSGASDSGAGPSDAWSPGADAMVLDTGTSSTWRSCARTSECELVHTGCCDGCGVPTVSSFDGVNRTRESEHFMDVCPMPTPCPACVSAPNANIVTTCASAQCSVLDVSTLPLSACHADADCMLRYASCCACSGTPEQVIAIRMDAESGIEGLLCDAGGCAADCIPMMPPGIALCDATTGHCRVAPTR